MKKIISLFLVVFSLLSLSACAKKQNAPGAGKIVFGEQYINVENADPERDYTSFFFEKDYLHKFVYYYSSSDRVYHYTITYKYEIIDEGTLAYFYDSVELHETHNATDAEEYNDSSGILLFSENVLYTQDGTLYARETYFKNELSNFGK